MSNYTIGVDLASGQDKTAVVICRQRNIRWYHLLLKRLGIIKHLATVQVVDMYEVERSQGNYTKASTEHKTPKGEN